MRHYRLQIILLGTLLQLPSAQAQSPELVMPGVRTPQQHQAQALLIVDECLALDTFYKMLDAQVAPTEAYQQLQQAHAVLATLLGRLLVNQADLFIPTNWTMHMLQWREQHSPFDDESLKEQLDWAQQQVGEWLIRGLLHYSWQRAIELGDSASVSTATEQAWIDTTLIFAEMLSAHDAATLLTPEVSTKIYKTIQRLGIDDPVLLTGVQKLNWVVSSGVALSDPRLAVVVQARQNAAAATTVVFPHRTVNLTHNPTSLRFWQASTRHGVALEPSALVQALTDLTNSLQLPLAVVQPAAINPRLAPAQPWAINMLNVGGL